MEDSEIGLRNHLTSFPSESWDQISSRKGRVQQSQGGKNVFARQGAPTGIKQGSEWRRPGILPPSCFFSGLTTRPHFLSRRGKELKSKVYH